MERYIEREKFLKKCAEAWGYAGVTIKAIEQIADECTTAEVVPKSEVERLQSEVERLKKDNEYILMQHRFQRRPSGDCWNDVIEKAKANVAWTIFDNVDEIAYRYLNDADYSAGDMIYDLNELKKKYTEEKT